MNKIRIILLFCAQLLLISCSGFNEYIAETEGIRVYDADYIKEYKNTFDVMFDNEWTVKSVEEKYEDPEGIYAHVDTRPQLFTEWTIEYYDGNEELRTFLFDNRQALSDQIEYYVTHYIPEYYKENFYNVYLEDVPLAPSSYVFTFLAKISVNRSDDDNQERVSKTDEYLKKLDTPEGTICLSKLTPANVFEMCPIYLTVNVSFSEYPQQNKESFEEGVKKKVIDMVEAMNEFTNNRLNAEISIGYHDIINLHDGKSKWYIDFIQGKPVYGKSGLYFERHVYDSYKDIFW